MLAPKPRPVQPHMLAPTTSMQAFMLAQKTGASTHACAKGFAQAHMLAPKALRKHRCLHQKLCASTHACTKLLAQAQMLAPKTLCKHRCLRQKPCLDLRAGGLRRARPRRLATKHRRRPNRCWGHAHWRRDGPDLGPETKRTWDPELCIIIYLMQADLGAFAGCKQTWDLGSPTQPQ